MVVQAGLRFDRREQFDAARQAVCDAGRCSAGNLRARCAQCGQRQRCACIACDRIGPLAFDPGAGAEPDIGTERGVGRLAARERHAGIGKAGDMAIARHGQCERSAGLAHPVSGGAQIGHADLGGQRPVVRHRQRIADRHVARPAVQAVAPGCAARPRQRARGAGIAAIIQDRRADPDITCRIAAVNACDDTIGAGRSAEPTDPLAAVEIARKRADRPVAVADADPAKEAVAAAAGLGGARVAIGTERVPLRDPLREGEEADILAVGGRKARSACDVGQAQRLVDAHLRRRCIGFGRQLRERLAVRRAARGQQRGQGGEQRTGRRLHLDRGIGIVDAARDLRVERGIAQELAEQLDPVGTLHDEPEQRRRLVDRRIATVDPAACDDQVVGRARPYRTVRDDAECRPRRDRKPTVDHQLVGDGRRDLEQRHRSARKRDVARHAHRARRSPGAERAGDGNVADHRPGRPEGRARAYRDLRRTDRRSRQADKSTTRHVDTAQRCIAGDRRIACGYAERLDVRDRPECDRCRGAAARYQDGVAASPAIDGPCKPACDREAVIGCPEHDRRRERRPRANRQVGRGIDALIGLSTRQRQRATTFAVQDLEVAQHVRAERAVARQLERRGVGPGSTRDGAKQRTVCRQAEAVIARTEIDHPGERAARRDDDVLRIVAEGQRGAGGAERSRHGQRAACKRDALEACCRAGQRDRCVCGEAQQVGARAAHIEAGRTGRAERQFVVAGAERDHRDIAVRRQHFSRVRACHGADDEATQREVEAGARKRDRLEILVERQAQRAAALDAQTLEVAALADAAAVAGEHDGVQIVAGAAIDIACHAASSALNEAVVAGPQQHGALDRAGVDDAVVTSGQVDAAGDRTRIGHGFVIRPAGDRHCAGAGEDLTGRDRHITARHADRVEAESPRIGDIAAADLREALEIDELVAIDRATHGRIDDQAIIALAGVDGADQHRIRALEEAVVARAEQDIALDPAAVLDAVVAVAEIDRPEDRAGIDDPVVGAARALDRTRQAGAGKRVAVRQHAAGAAPDRAAVGQVERGAGYQQRDRGRAGRLDRPAVGDRPGYIGPGIDQQSDRRTGVGVGRAVPILIGLRQAVAGRLDRPAIGDRVGRADSRAEPVLYVQLRGNAALSAGGDGTVIGQCDRARAAARIVIAAGRNH